MKLFIGNLSWNTTESDLHRQFNSFGPLLESKIITDRETGRSRGFAFVTYETKEDAMSAINTMDGTMLDGRNIKVNQAQERQPRF